MAVELELPGNGSLNKDHDVNSSATEGASRSVRCTAGQVHLVAANCVLRDAGPFRSQSYQGTRIRSPGVVQYSGIGHADFKKAVKAMENIDAVGGQAVVEKLLKILDADRRSS